MTCTEVRAQLAALVYGDLDAPTAAQVETHVATCPACREERGALTEVRHMLDAVPAPRAAVDLAALYRREADRQTARLRRWRRFAVALAGAAALVLLAVGLPVEVRVADHQLSLRWGPPPSIAPAPDTLPVAGPPRPPADEAHLQLLREVVHAMQRDADSRDLQRQQELIQLYARLAVLQGQTDQRWAAMEKTVAALYILTQKGNEP